MTAETPQHGASRMAAPAAAALVTALFLWASARPAEPQVLVPPADQRRQPGPSAEQLTPEELERRILEWHSGIAWRTLNRGQFQTAEAMFRDILRRAPDRPREIAGLAAALARQGKLDEAIEVLRDGTQRFPQDATLASGLGQAYLSANRNGAAIRWLERAWDLDPDMPDVRYFLGSAYLRCQYPLMALDVLCSAATSGREMDWVQDLAIGTAFSQLGLESQAAGYFSSVSSAAQDTPLANNARQLQRYMDDALFDRPYLSGSLKVTERYDDNPGVTPVADVVGGALGQQRTAGNLYLGQLSYDLLRDYNYDVAVGYNFYHTSNYEAHEFDIVDDAAFLAATRREYWHCMPVHLGLRCDYDHMFFGSADFLQRLIATPSLELITSDWDSTALLFRYGLYDFLRQAPLDGTPFDLDSDNLGVGILWRRLLLSRRLTLVGGYEFDDNLADGSNFDYTGHKARLGVDWRTGLGGLRVGASGELHWRGYDNPHFIFGVHRDDEEYQVQVTLAYPLADRWWLSAEWAFDRNDSNIPTNDYHRHTLDLGLEYRFPTGRSD